MKLSPSVLQFDLKIKAWTKDLRIKIENSQSEDIKDFSNELCELFSAIDNSSLSSKQKSDCHNDVFIQLSRFWITNLEIKFFYKSEKFIKDLLDVTYEWDKANFGREKIHKGALFYYLGITYILGGVIDKGYLSFYQSLEEDRQLFSLRWPNTYSFKFLKGESKVFDKWVGEQEKLIIQILKEYNSQQDTEFEYKFLREIIDINIDPLITINLFYGISKILHLNEAQGFLSNNEFVDQINLNIISILGTCLEKIIKKYYPVPNKGKKKKRFSDLKDHVEAFFSHHNENKFIMIDNYDNFLTVKNKKGEISFIDGIINNPQDYFDKELNPICKDIIVFHHIRNFAAHELVSEKQIQKNMEKIYQSIFNVFFFICQNRVNINL